MAILQRIVDGELDLAFRCWTRPGAKRGGTMRTALGVLVVDELDTIELAAITDAEARRAGSRDAEELRAFLATRAGTIYRMRLRHLGDDPRIALRQEAEVSPDELEVVTKKLARLDRASAAGPWTRATLELIEAHPERRAGDLAELVGREKDPFKLDVRKLKNLGLTESLEVGYRISPRGAAVLRAVRNQGDG